MNNPLRGLGMPLKPLIDHEPSNEDKAESVTLPEGISRQGLAAFCLYGQEFGFTREDVEGLRMMLQREGPHVHLYGSVATLADRIEALLPPE